VPFCTRGLRVEEYPQGTGQEIKLDGVEYLIMKEDDVLAIENADAGSRIGADTASRSRA
jgi:Chaperonin 10 Kd subunit